MPSVKSVAIGRDRPWTNGLRRRRYDVVYTDELGVDHTIREMPVNVLDTDDGTSLAAAKLAERAEREANQYMNKIRAGIPVDFLQAKWNNSSALFRAVAREAFVIRGTDELALEFISYVDALTDNQLATIFSRGQAWVDGIRAKAIQINAIKDARDAYTPEDIS